MKAVVTVFDEPTEWVAAWALERNGFDVITIKGPSTLAQKLEEIYNSIDEDFIRVDADVIVNRNCTPSNIIASLDEFDNISPIWIQYVIFDWYKQDLGHGGVQFYRKEALPVLREHIAHYKTYERPESAMFRLAEFHNPRVCVSSDLVMGVHGYGIHHTKRVRDTKARREQTDNYDWSLWQRLEEL